MWNQLFLTWFEKCIIVIGTDDNQGPKFSITDKKRYVPVVTLSAQDNKQLIQYLKISFKRTMTGININHNQQHRRETDIQIT